MVFFHRDGLRKTSSGGTWSLNDRVAQLKADCLFLASEFPLPVSYQYISSYHTDYVRRWLKHNAWYKVNLSKHSFHFFFEYIFRLTLAIKQYAQVSEKDRSEYGMGRHNITHKLTFISQYFICIYTLILFLAYLKNSTSKIIVKSCCLFHIYFSPVIHKCSVR